MDGADDEQLAVSLRGASVGKTRVDLGIAGPFLFRLNELIHAIASVVNGRRPGARGELPDVPGAGLLALAGVAWGESVTFHFGLGTGEELRLFDRSLTEEAVSILTGLLASTSSAADEQLYQLTRNLGPRVGTNFRNVVVHLEHSRVDSYWRTVEAGEAIDLSVPRVRRAKTVLDSEAPPEIFEQTVEGHLYRADSKEHQFILEPLDGNGGKISGTYDIGLREEIREAWDKVVVVRLRITHHFIARQIEPARVEVELIEVTRIVGDS